jgi:hypothetical protein
MGGPSFRVKAEIVPPDTASCEIRLSANQVFYKGVNFSIKTPQPGLPELEEKRSRLFFWRN